MKFKKEILFFSLSAMAFLAYKSIRTSVVGSPGFTGFIGDTYVRFPANEYTFLIKRVKEGDRYVIKDNLWGFHYPDLRPMQHSDRGEFMKMINGWVWVAVEPRTNPNICYSDVIKKYTDPDQEPLSLRTPKKYEVDDFDPRAVMNVLPYKMYALNAMTAPEKSYIKDVHAYMGPQLILWSSAGRKLEACTYINCIKISNRSDDQNCTHRYVNQRSKLAFTISYEGKYLANWQEIERHTQKLFESFKASGKKARH